MPRLKSDLLVAIFGPDGSGKSTVADNIQAALLLASTPSERHHWRPRKLASLKSAIDPKPCSSPDNLPQRGLLLSIFCYFYFYFDFFSFGLFNIKLNCGTKRVIIYERYFYDIIFHPRRYMLKNTPILGKFLSRLTIQPDLTIVLTGNPDIIHRRKPELTTKEIFRQTSIMKSSLSVLCNAVFFNVDNQSPQEISDKIITLINNKI